MIPTSECVCSENRVLDDDYSVVLFGMMLFACYWICGFLLGNRSQKKWLKFCSFFSQIWFFTKEKKIGAKQQWKLYLRPLYFSPCIMRKQSEFPPTKFASEYVWMYCLIGMTSNTKRWYFFFNVTVVIS